MSSGSQEQMSSSDNQKGHFTSQSSGRFSVSAKWRESSLWAASRDTPDTSIVAGAPSLFINSVTHQTKSIHHPQTTDLAIQESFFQSHPREFFRNLH